MAGGFPPRGTLIELGVRPGWIGYVPALGATGRIGPDIELWVAAVYTDVVVVSLDVSR